MNTNEYGVRRCQNALDLLPIHLMYLSAFPPEERKPFRRIVQKWRKGETDIWVLERAGRFAGFATTVNGNRHILLDYLAVKKSMRGKGVGRMALREIKKQYSGKGVFVEIESEYEKCKDAHLRRRRKRFYLESGMKPLYVMADVFGVPMELLGWDCEMDFASYHSFYHRYMGAYSASHVKELPHPGKKEGVCAP